MKGKMNKTGKLFIEIIGIVLVAAIFMTFIAIQGKRNKPNYAEKIAASVNQTQLVQATQQQDVIYSEIIPSSQAPASTAATTAAATVPVAQTSVPAATQAPVATTAAPFATEAPAQAQTTVPTTADVSQMSKAQIVQFLGNAVNKTKGYNGDITVQHTEAFDNIEIVNITGGSLVKSVANSLIGGVVKPSDEVLSFHAGTATNKEGELMTLLLPQKGAYSLTDDGVASATIQRVGDGVVVDLTLVSESVGMNDAPRHNAAGIGYLDVSKLDLSILTVTKADITYPGSTIHAEINADGYVTKAVYTIKLHVDGAGKSGPINGTAEIEGAEVETWILNW